MYLVRLLSVYHADHAIRVIDHMPQMINADHKCKVHYQVYLHSTLQTVQKVATNANRGDTLSDILDFN
jgi:hypothetical protein